ncbi:hypothetical protein EGJ55_07625 [Pseudomonas moraviensis]|nr:hypothetical protein EGJ55_07625 [Pseudomonas moraviensis]
MIVPTLCVGMPQRTLCVRFWDAERPGLHSHAERGNDHLITATTHQSEQPSRCPVRHNETAARANRSPDG